MPKIEIVYNGIEEQLYPRPESLFDMHMSAATKLPQELEIKLSRIIS
jgi:hypothetical protein